ncbi:IclR family transcriptional regulator [Succinatimonas hippei]|uniref:HTH-type transcriptional repressor AllR n=1 Tax=Succinatimonas hippei (strain DSM 22608 / JCM 16073 / KCTC 15190 / YIT 12066) TaxID=762983 RepID=E8LMN0_SUCHY|nr:IclR family transcriptional regulator [Succinatimonas hippei]EFY06214.1 IclR helix-turn-helix domain protein [Succinatimonas hippei YIT 12066]
MFMNDFYSHSVKNEDLQSNTKQVKSVVRTVDLLLLFADTRRYLTLQDISEMMNLPKSSTFELVNTMVQKGILELKNSGKKTYGLSLLAFEIGSAAVADLGVIDIARPYLQELNRVTGGTVFLGTENRGKIVYLDRAEDLSLVKADAKIGSRRDLHSTSLGKAMLYAYPDDLILKLLGPEPYPANTPLTKTTSFAILQDARISRERGFAVDDREDGPYMYCIGSVLRNHRNEPVASISVSSLVNQITENKKRFIADKVKEAALQISRQLGFCGEILY